MPKADDGVEDIDQSAPAGGGQEESAAPQTDYKALLEKEIAEKEQWKESALKNKRLLKKTEPIEETPDTGNETEDERIERMAHAVSAKVVTTVTEDSLLKSKITDPEQRKLVKFYLENKLVRTGTSEEALESDIETALILATGKKAIVENAELKRMKANDSRVAPAAGSSVDRGVERKAHQWSPEQEKILTQKAKDLRIDPQKFLTDSWNNRSRTSSIG